MRTSRPSGACPTRAPDSGSASGVWSRAGWSARRPGAEKPSGGRRRLRAASSGAHRPLRGSLSPRPSTTRRPPRTSAARGDGPRAGGVADERPRCFDHEGGGDGLSLNGDRHLDREGVVGLDGELDRAPCEPLRPVPGRRPHERCGAAGEVRRPSRSSLVSGAGRATTSTTAGTSRPRRRRRNGASAPLGPTTGRATPSASPSTSAMPPVGTHGSSWVPRRGGRVRRPRASGA